ncbi:MAG TPA: pyridoxamine 5'-phosphate oxidase family protein, partial [Spirochaetota bacterium]
MRRAEFSHVDKSIIDDFLARGKSGVLAVIDPDGLPYAVPLNFFYLNGVIYFHGASVGKKIESIRQRADSQFTVYREYSYIPSDALGGE